jgi:hypothetical protein
VSGFTGCYAQEIRDEYKCDRIKNKSKCTATALPDCPGGLKLNKKCSGKGFSDVKCCEAPNECFKKNNFYGQCLKPTVKLPATWEGTVQDCKD